MIVKLFSEYAYTPILIDVAWFFTAMAISAMLGHKSVPTQKLWAMFALSVIMGIVIALLG